MIDNALNNIALSGTAAAMLTLTVLFGTIRALRRGQSLDLVDVFVVMTGLYFGGYTLVDSLMNDRSWARADLVIWVHVMILVIVMLAWGLTRTIPQRLLDSLQISTILRRCLAVDGRAIVLLMSVLLGITIYGFYAFGVLSILSVAEGTLPYWYSAVKMLFLPLTFGVLIGTAYRSFRNQGDNKLLWVLGLVMALFLVGLYGRRMFLGALFVVLFIWLITRRVSIASTKVVTIGLVTFLLIGIFSNVYNSYRRAGITGNTIEASDVEVVDAIMDYENTLTSLERRRPTWVWNYLLLAAQERSRHPTPLYGELIMDQVMAKIPRVFWPSKGRQEQADEMVAGHYGLPELDYPDNLFAYAFGEWGYYCLLITPLGLYVFFLFNALMLQLFHKHPLAVLLVAGVCLYATVAVESSDPGHLMAYRTMGVFLAAYVAIYLTSIHLQWVLRGARDESRPDMHAAGGNG